MRIGIDGWELEGRPTGVGRYLSALLTEWDRLEAASAHEFVVFEREPGSGARSTARGGRFQSRVLRVSRRTVWEQVHLRRALGRERIGVLFAPAYSAPILTGIPAVLTIHDVSFLAHPEWFPPRERLRRAWTTRLAARSARLVLTDTEFSRDEVVRLIGLRRDRVRVVPLGAPSWLSTNPGVAPSTPAASEREPLVLYVGSIFNRRNVADLVRAFALVGRDRPDARLELVGENRTYPRQEIGRIIVDNGLGGRARLRDYVTNAELLDCYRRASVFAFLSEYEGFGLTPLEAIACGVPPVLLDTAVAREVFADAAVFVQRGDIGGTAAAIGSLLNDPARRRELAERGRVLLNRFSWRTAAERTLEALVDAGT